MTRMNRIALTFAFVILAYPSMPSLANSNTPRLTRSVIQNTVKEWHDFDVVVTNFKLYRYKRITSATKQRPMVITVPMAKRNGRICYFSMTVELHPAEPELPWRIEIQQLRTPPSVGCPRPRHFNFTAYYNDVINRK